MAFSGCSSLTQIIIPQSVTSICSDAFNKCTSLPENTIQTRLLIDTKFSSATFCQNRVNDNDHDKLALVNKANQNESEWNIFNKNTSKSSWRNRSRVNWFKK